MLKTRRKIVTVVQDRFLNSPPAGTLIHQTENVVGFNSKNEPKPDKPGLSGVPMHRLGNKSEKQSVLPTAKE